MVDNLQKRSLASKVFVSFSSCAPTPFSERDTTTDKSMLEKLSNVNGDTQGKSKWMKTYKVKLALLLIHYRYASLFAIFTT